MIAARTTALTCPDRGGGVEGGKRKEKILSGKSTLIWKIKKMEEAEEDRESTLVIDSEVEDDDDDGYLEGEEEYVEEDLEEEEEEEVVQVMGEVQMTEQEVVHLDMDLLLQVPAGAEEDTSGTEEDISMVSPRRVRKKYFLNQAVPKYPMLFRLPISPTPFWTTITAWPSYPRRPTKQGRRWSYKRRRRKRRPSTCPCQPRLLPRPLPATLTRSLSSARSAGGPGPGDFRFLLWLPMRANALQSTSPTLRTVVLPFPSSTIVHAKAVLYSTTYGAPN